MDKTILLVEDHKETQNMVRAVLERDGFKLAFTETVKGAKDYLKKHTPDLMILDLVLPDGNGLEICEMARNSETFAKTPIIALTGLTELKDKQRGFAVGVDQYLEKPIIIDELSLWVKALFRRVEWNSHAGTYLRFGDLQICSESFVVKFNKTTIGNLTSREFDLFHFLVKSSPKVISRADIIAEVWKTAAVDNLVDTHIFNLRQKLPRQLAARVQAVSGKGFRYFAAEQD